MSKEIAAGRKSSSFASAVVGLTGLNATLAALDHLSPTKLSTSVIGRFNEAYIGDSSGKIKALTENIETLQKELDAIEKRLAEIDDEIDAAENSKAKFEDDIKQYADGERLQNERDRLNRDLTAAKKTKAQFIKSLCSDFNDDMTAFFALSMVQKHLRWSQRVTLVAKTFRLCIPKPLSSCWIVEHAYAGRNLWKVVFRTRI